MAEATHLLELTDLTRRFVRRGVPFDAVGHVNLTVDAGEFIAIVGRSGNGKSTLINMVAGLVRPSSGAVRVNGRDVSALNDRELSLLRNRTIGFVTQSQTLLANLTVLDNVILPATMFPHEPPIAPDAQDAENAADDARDGAIRPVSDVSDATGVSDGGPGPGGGDGNGDGNEPFIDPYMPDVIAPMATPAAGPSDAAADTSDPLASRARRLLARLGIADLAGGYPRELSGGEMRRVSIARALMNRPALLIADEPTGDLDQESTDIVMRLLREQADAGTAILMVTHDPDALGYADKVYRMDAGTLSKV